jgi:hypothetical protein
MAPARGRDPNPIRNPPSTIAVLDPRVRLILHLTSEDEPPSRSKHALQQGYCTRSLAAEQRKSTTSNKLEELPSHRPVHPLKTSHRVFGVAVREGGELACLAQNDDNFKRAPGERLDLEAEREPPPAVEQEF